MKRLSKQTLPLNAQQYVKNNTNLQWDIVIRTFIDYHNSRVTTNPLPLEKLSEIGETISSNIVTSFSEIVI